MFQLNCSITKISTTFFLLKLETLANASFHRAEPVVGYISLNAKKNVLCLDQSSHSNWTDKNLHCSPRSVSRLSGLTYSTCVPNGRDYVQMLGCLECCCYNVFLFYFKVYAIGEDTYQIAALFGV